MPSQLLALAKNFQAHIPELNFQAHIPEFCLINVPGRTGSEYAELALLPVVVA